MRDQIGRDAAHSVVTQIKDILPPPLWDKIRMIYVVGSYARYSPRSADPRSDLDIWIWADAYQHETRMMADNTPNLIRRILGRRALFVNTLIAKKVPLDILVYSYHPPTDYSRETVYYNDKYEFV